MNLPNTKLPFVATVVIAALLTGCATTQPIPEITQPQSAAIAIDMTLKAPIGIFSSKPDQIYFVKTDSGDGLLQQQIIRSNYAKDGRAYLLNARPGTYVAVAAFFSRTGVPAGPASPGVSVTVATGRSGYTTYFSKELVKHTEVTVRENDFVFMGSFVVDQSAGLDGADEVQVHYKNVIAPGETTSLLGMAFGGSSHYRGVMSERNVDERTRTEFIQKAKDDLAGSGWAARVK
jgi:hypothetical protein